MLPLFLISTVVFLISLPSHAQDHTEDGDHHHDSVIHLGPIDVLGESSESDILHTIPSVSNLHGDELFRKSESSLGETLRNELGVNSSQFGPASSRPVIRGLEGDRIRILQNGIGVLDASGTSQDHAVPINPLSAESVEVVRGPISLLYGSSAVGGVVNIVNSRIHKNYFQGFFGGLDSKYESVNQGNTLASKMDYGTNNFMFHVDGHYNRTQNFETPLGEVPNSEMEQHSVAVGATYFTPAKNHLGLSVSRFQNIYGAVSEPDVDINLQQERIDLSGYYALDGFFSGLRLKSAQTFYEHREIEDGQTGTVFDNTGNETRVELVQRNQGGLHGIFGLQTQVLELSAMGDEAFLPTTDHQTLALFLFEELELENWKFNGGLRGEQSVLKAQAGNILATGVEKDFTTGSAALGMNYSLSSTMSTSLNLSYNERAPTYQELYANGPHLAIGIFEVGAANLEKESSLAVEWNIKRNSPLFYTSLTLFNQEFQNFVSLNPSGVFDDTDESGIAGDSPDDFEVYNYLSQKARINGFEFEARHRFHPWWSFRFTTDYLYGQNTEIDRPLPRISPLRVGFSLMYQREALGGSLTWRNVLKQTRTAPGETATPSYNLLDFSLDYKVAISNESFLKLYLQVNNMADIKARNHVSILKDQLLLPGRNVVGGLRWLF